MRSSGDIPLSLLFLGSGCRLPNLALGVSLIHPFSLFFHPPKPLPSGLLLVPFFSCVPPLTQPSQDPKSPSSFATLVLDHVVSPSPGDAMGLETSRLSTDWAGQPWNPHSFWWDSVFRSRSLRGSKEYLNEFHVPECSLSHFEQKCPLRRLKTSRSGPTYCPEPG